MRFCKTNLKAAGTAAMVIIAVAALLVFLLFRPGKEVLILKDGESGKIYAKYEANQGMTFSVSFIHSVNKTRVKEAYEIKDGAIYLESCLYSDFGAGVATEVEEGQSLTYTEDGEMFLSGFNRRIEGLSYIVGTVSDHILEIDGEEISLRDLCGRNSTVRFEVVK
ncbi:MAG TPA: hypothetical protein DIC60_05825 [Lachnospiraceae bacterium]|nr:hypothetical protein [Lachnospiraceae bacterium]